MHKLNGCVQLNSRFFQAHALTNLIIPSNLERQEINAETDMHPMIFSGVIHEKNIRISKYLNKVH